MTLDRKALYEAVEFIDKTYDYLHKTGTALHLIGLHVFRLLSIDLWRSSILFFSMICAFDI